MSTYYDELMARPLDHKAELSVACAEVDSLRARLAAAERKASEAGKKRLTAFIITGYPAHKS